MLKAVHDSTLNEVYTCSGRLSVTLKDNCVVCRFSKSKYIAIYTAYVQFFFVDILKLKIIELRLLVMIICI